MDGATANARRKYHHVHNGGKLTESDVAGMVRAMEDKDATIARLTAERDEPQPVIEVADMKRCAGCGSVRDRRGMDCLEDASWRCGDCIKSKPVDDGLIAMNACLVQLDMLVAESGRGVDWGEEDAFRMGEWFEDTDLANIERAKAFVTDLFRATPSSAGTVSVEALKELITQFTLEVSPENDPTKFDYLPKDHPWQPQPSYEATIRVRWFGAMPPALRALAGEGGR